MLKRRLISQTETVSQIESVTTVEQVESDKINLRKKESIKFDKVVSTGSTVLDLNISGKRIRGGGLPGGIIIEVYGRSGTGKTAVLEEIGASTQSKGGEIEYVDPEARLDAEYAEIYGMHINSKNYRRPDTVTELFEDCIWGWKCKNENVINTILSDSLAALSTELEMGEGDKRGQRRAKEFSEGLRKTCRMIAKNNWLIVCSNQVRQGDKGDVTPGGMAIPFYASLRIRMAQVYGSGLSHKIIKKEDVNGKAFEKVVGIRSSCEIIKSSLDDPYRKCNISILFNYGIDDIRDNLQYVKDVEQRNTYYCIGREYRSMEHAIKYIEENGLRADLKNYVIDLWEDIEKKFVVNRPKKER